LRRAGEVENPTLIGKKKVSHIFGAKRRIYVVGNGMIIATPITGLVAPVRFADYIADIVLCS
jgi:hypothetical protein